MIQIDMEMPKNCLDCNLRYQSFCSVDGHHEPHLEKERCPLKVTPQEPKIGHWITKIKSDLRGDMWPTNPKCSECGGEPYYSNTIYNYKFCPYCGARMIEPQESEDT